MDDGQKYSCLFLKNLLTYLGFHPHLKLLENVEHCGGEPEQTANMHMINYKLHAEMMS